MRFLETSMPVPALAHPTRTHPDPEAHALQRAGRNHAVIASMLGDALDPPTLRDPLQRGLCLLAAGLVKLRRVEVRDPHLDPIGR